MFDYLEQFKRLPKELREKISSPAAMAVLSELEKKYNLALAATVMKVMVKIISVRDLSIHFISDFSLTPEAARNLSNELRERLFFVVAGYLGLKNAPSNDEKTVIEIIKNSQLGFPSTELSNRARQVVLTYLRGVRSKIDARDVLEKPINNGGLNLSREESSRLLREVDHFSIKTTTENNSFQTESADKNTRADLQEIISKYDQQTAYDLKKELTSGRTPSLLASPLIKQLEAKTKEEITSGKIQSDQVSDKSSKDQLSEINKFEKELLSSETETDNGDDLADLMRQISIDQKIKTTSTDFQSTTKPSPSDKDQLMTKEVVPPDSIKTEMPVSETSIPVSTPVLTPWTDIPPIISNQTSTSFAPPSKKSFFARLFSKKKEKTTIKIEIGKPETISSQPLKSSTSPIKYHLTPGLKKSVNKETEPKSSESQLVTDAIEMEQADKLTVKVGSTKEKTTSTSEPVIEKTIDQATSQTSRLAPNFLEQKTGFFHRSAAGSDFKTKVEDIKAAPKIMGPIEELRYLDLVNFRRLGPPPEEATRKIRAKIKLLEKEGYDRRLVAVAAWKKSPVSRLYVMIGQEAVSQGITMKEAAAMRKSKNQEYLSWEEIQAIVQLNSSLMF